MYIKTKIYNTSLMKILIFCCIFIFAWNSYAKNSNRIEKHEINIKNSELHKLNNNLLNYIKQPETSSWSIKSNYFDRYYQVRVIKLVVTTLTWPDKFATVTTDYPNWQHNIILYIPKKIKHDTALLYVGSGLLHPSGTKYRRTGVNCSKIANNTSSIVIEARDIPNQTLTFSANKKHPKYNSKLPDEPVIKKGNDLLIYSYHKYIEDPKSNKHMPLLLPMTKSIMRIMTICQKVLQQNHNVTINNFVLSGSSKRGWATWLTASIDSRISAIIPIAADFFNLKKLLATKKQDDFSLAKLLKADKTLNLKNLNNLLELLDLSNYIPQIDLPKFIISSLSDTYIPPNHLHSYIYTLAHTTHLRIISNASHYLMIDKPSVMHNSIAAFYSCFLTKKAIPEINYYISNNDLVVTTTQPHKVKQVLLRTTLSLSENFSKYHTNRTTHIVRRIKFNKKKQKIVINLRETKKVYSAHTVEIRYENKPYTDLIFTTPVFIIPAGDQKK